MFFKKYLNVVLISVNILLTICLFGFILYTYFFKDNNVDSYEDVQNVYVQKENNQEEILDEIFVEVKGAVVSPGVYKFNSKSIINDLITSAGGFLNNAFTNNLNLSKKLQDQMVIYVYTKYEYSLLNIKKEDVTPNEVCSCQSVDISSCLSAGVSVIESKKEVKQNINEKDINSSSQTNDIIGSNETNLININTAGITELMTLNGIGEAKAKNIISYREEHGNFTSIENIKDVSGISDSIYEKIKDYITV